MRRATTSLVLAAAGLLCLSVAWAAEPAVDRHAAPTPPMGWNSYDAYGTTVTEEQFRANAASLSRELKKFGWRYAVVDMEWFVRNPTPSGNGKHSIVTLDAYGRYLPAVNRFPSAGDGSGFKTLADYVHSLGLSFGIHILQGIPQEAVRRNLPIADSAYRAADAADRTSTCPWNPDNVGIDTASAAGRAYYASLAKLYASWGVDLIKVDCIASHPYKEADIALLSEVVRANGGGTVLSLSPGPAPLDALPQLRARADMWRISNDVWDLWHSNEPYPRGLGDQFGAASQWATAAGSGHWPDADMLSLGYLGPAPGWGAPRWTRLSHAEQRTYMTLWCMARSPLMMGGNLTRLDDWTRSLLDNADVLEVDQHATDAHLALKRAPIEVWVSRPEGASGYNVAAFNLGRSARSLAVPWSALALPAGVYRGRDLWTQQALQPSPTLRVTLPAHGSALYRVSVPESR